MFSIITLYGICHLILAILCITMKICGKGYLHENKYVKVIDLVPYLILTFNLIYNVITLKHQYCSFHYECYGGIEEMHYHSISYDTYNGCLDSSSIGDVINKYYELEEDNNIECEDTDFGCCYIENKCQTSYEFNMNFTEYQKYYILGEDRKMGVINTFITKKNHDGDNCLTFNDYINFYQMREINNVLLIYFLALDGYILFYIILVCIDCCKDKHAFEKVQQESV